MNKPERPEIFARAQGLLRTAADKSGSALRTVADAGGSVMGAVGGGANRIWTKATYDPDDNVRRRRIVVITGLAVIAAIAVMFVLSRIGGDDNVPVAPSTGQSVSVVTTQTHTFQPTVALNGEARPVRDIQVSAPATGVRILALLVDEGDTVRAGQPMARLDTNLAQAQIRAAQASVAEAQSAAVRARGEYDRAESIRDSGALSTEAIEARRAAATAADARLAAARAQAQEVNARLGGGYVRAPESGLVIDRMAEVGRNVDGQVLFRIAGGNQLEVAAQVAESDALALQDGQAATFSLVDGTSVEARLRRAPASIDSRTRTGEALFTLPMGTRVRAGMYLRGQALLAPRDVLSVSQASILYDAGQAYVFTVDQQNRVRRANVELGAREGEMVEVRSGLELNQRVVGSGAAFLQDGDIVSPLAAAQPAAPANGASLRGRED